MKFLRSIDNKKVNAVVAILGVPSVAIGFYVGGTIGLIIAAVGLLSLRLLAWQ